MKHPHHLLIAFLLLLGAWSCSHTPVPKPMGYLRLDIPQGVYSKTTPSTLPFTFTYDSATHLSVLPNKGVYSSVWLEYPQWNATILCTHLQMTPSSFAKISTESYQLIYQHNVVASAIEEYPIAEPSHKVYGTLYRLQGKVATPYQMELTDSIHHFFRATVSINTVINPDSLAPIYQRLEKDLKVIAKTLKFKP